MFEAPLYATFSLGEDLKHASIMYGRVKGTGRHDRVTADAFCPFCKSDSTFAINGVRLYSSDEWNDIKERFAYDEMRITCTRNENHQILFYFRIRNMIIQKVGQCPSLADMAIEETRQKYRKVLTGDNWRELYKAIGLAAHGEGIGAFVYLRRVFERLIRSRFDEFKDAEGWKEEDFGILRMDEKIAFLKDHLPPFLVQIRKIYSIFSIGVHELDNDDCLRFFEVGKRSIVVILEEDMKKREELTARQELANAIAKFQPSSQEQN